MERMNMEILIVKIGSSVLLTHRNKLDEFRIAHIADQIIFLREKGYDVVLVVSGAVACGANFIKFSKEDKNLRQVAAGVGQAYLISVFQQIFSRKHLKIAQLLVTKDLLLLEDKKQLIKNLLRQYLQLGAIPIINENDVIDLNSFGGNDFLAGELAILLDVSQLLILSTIKGSKYGIGGGEIKQKVLNILDKKNIKANIADGKVQNIVLKSVLWKRQLILKK